MEKLSNTSDLLPFIKKNQSLIISGIIIVVVFILTVVFLIPNIQKIQEVTISSETKEQTLNNLRAKVTILDSIQKEEELFTLKKIIAILPEEKDVFTIFTGIDTLERESGVVITKSDLKVGVISTESALTRSSKEDNLSVEINFEALGSKESILRLFDVLQSMKTRLFTARRVKIEYLSPDSLSVSFTILAYYSPFPAKLGSVDSQIVPLSEKMVSLKDAIMREAMPVSEEVPDVPKGKTDLFSL